MAELDILTLEEAQAVAKTFSATNAPDLEAMVTGLSAWVDKLCGPVVAREVEVVLSGPYSGPLLLTTTPVISVDEVIETNGTTPTTLDVGDYQLDAQGHFVRLYRRTGGLDSHWITGNRNIAVTVTAGRYETTEDVGYDWKERFRSVLSAKWSWESAAWQRNRGEMPSDDGGFPATFDAESVIRSLFSSELLPPGIA